MDPNLLAVFLAANAPFAPGPRTFPSDDPGDCCYHTEACARREFWEELVNTAADTYTRTDPNFNRDHFLRTCGL